MIADITDDDVTMHSIPALAEPAEQPPTSTHTASPELDPSPSRPLSWKKTLRLYKTGKLLDHVVPFMKPWEATFLTHAGKQVHVRLCRDDKSGNPLAIKLTPLTKMTEIPDEHLVDDLGKAWDAVSYVAKSTVERDILVNAFKVPSTPKSTQTAAASAHTSSPAPKKRKQPETSTTLGEMLKFQRSDATEDLMKKIVQEVERVIGAEAFDDQQKRNLHLALKVASRKRDHEEATKKAREWTARAQQLSTPFPFDDM